MSRDDKYHKRLCEEYERLAKFRKRLTADSSNGETTSNVAFDVSDFVPGVIDLDSDSQDPEPQPKTQHESKAPTPCKGPRTPGLESQEPQTRSLASMLESIAESDAKLPNDLSSKGPPLLPAANKSSPNPSTPVGISGHETHLEFESVHSSQDTLHFDCDFESQPYVAADSQEPESQCTQSQFW